MKDAMKTECKNVFEVVDHLNERLKGLNEQIKGFE